MNTATATDQRTTAVGTLLKGWREKRRISQLALALDAGVSSRHLSFVETGRARPSAELLVALTERLDVPLRQRNDMLIAAGYAPRYPEHRLNSPTLATACRAVERLLAAHDPYPGLALDRLWTVVLTNRTAQRLTALLPEFLTGPINMFRASLHPSGFARLTTNFDEWARYLLTELERLAARTLDPVVDALLAEVRAYDNVAALLKRPALPPRGADDGLLLVPCELSVGGHNVSFFTTLMSFGSPRDVTLDELVVELFYPSDDATAEYLREGDQRAKA